MLENTQKYFENMESSCHKASIEAIECLESYENFKILLVASIFSKGQKMMEHFEISENNRKNN